MTRGLRHDPATALVALLALMQRLRDPVAGCPWDRQQDFSTIAPYTIEEAYEVADAIAQGSMSQLREELGDLLFQVVFHCQLAAERGAFDFADAAMALVEKMTRRHPHVFGDAPAAADQPDAWETIKEAERAAKMPDGGQAAPAPSALDGVPVALPALTRAAKLQKRAARQGFDWPDIDGVWAKVDEEMAELKAAAPEGPARQAEEFGDLLFACVNLGRHLGLDPETALRHANEKFERRFKQVEAQLRHQGQAMREMDLDGLESLWQEAKKNT